MSQIMTDIVYDKELLKNQFINMSIVFMAKNY